MATIKKDPISELLECSFRGISFPTISVDVSFQHDIVRHRRMDRNGAKLENTGLNVFMFNITAPFCNTIARGASETWDKLYPDQYVALLDALQDRSTGDFVHPEFGSRRCKADNVKSSLSPEYRSGVVLTFSLIEDTEDDANAIITTDSFAFGATAAINLDAALGALNPPVDSGIELDGFDSFSDFMDSIQASFDQVGLLEKQVIGKIDRVIGKVNNLTTSITDPIKWLGTAPDEFIDSLLQIKKNALVQEQKTTGFYQTTSRMTLFALCDYLSNSPSEIAELNPGIISSSIVKPFTIVRYYK